MYDLGRKVDQIILLTDWGEVWYNKPDRYRD
jgi:hypothetical protein